MRHWEGNTDEGLMASVKEGAVDNLQDEGEVLQRENRTGETHTEEETLQRGQEEGEKGRVQVCLPLGFPRN